jgi:oligopeptide/dipeptide ABC transporter ATP-binding protein
MKAEHEAPLLDVRGLKTQFKLAEGVVRAVDGVDLTVNAGETLCVVGESGCGKSVMARSILQLVEPPGRIAGGSIWFRPDGDSDPVDLAKLNPKGAELRRIRGKEIAMIFQEPMVSLSPVHTIGHQIAENLRTHEDVTKREARERAIDELAAVGIPRPAERFDAYTFQLSGGMRQRAMIALALACRPKLLIADEPTTALDVTTQAQILELLQGLQEQLGMAVMFITHDLGVVAEIADRVTVMYLGLVAEHCLVDDLFHDPKHPYTKALLRSIPVIGPRAAHRLETIRGSVPHPYNRPKGCPFHTRCDDFVPELCDAEVPALLQADDRSVRCVKGELS